MGEALYRKWRSQTFDEVIGQEHVTRTLRNALRQGRIAHAYLFTGPRGTGKTSTARLLARAVNCTSTEGEKPCNHCQTCRAIAEDRLLDLIEIDAASHRGIDDIRDLREKVKFAAGDARFKVYIIDEVHALTADAFNALLKTLEEPPPHVIFVLATTEPHKVPMTVLSRCQRFDFRPIPLEPMLRRLDQIAQAEGLVVEPQALELIARSATGSLRDSISLLDQLSSYGTGEITVAQVRDILGAVSVQAVSALVDRLVAKDVAGGLALINQMMGDGLDPRQLARELLDYVRSLLLLRSGSRQTIVNVTTETLDVMQAQAQALSMPDLVRLARLFTQAGLDLKGSVFPQLPLELAFVEAVLPRSAEPVREAAKEQPPLRPASAGRDEVRPVRTERQPEAAPRAPAVEKPASAPAAHTGASPELDRVHQVWPKFVEQVGARSKTLQAFLRDGWPVDVDGDQIVLGFRYQLHRDKVGDPKAKAVIEQMLGEMLGTPRCQVRCVVASGDQKAPRRAAPAKAVRESPGAVADTSHPVIDYAVKEMGARATPVVKSPSPEGAQEEPRE